MNWHARLMGFLLTCAVLIGLNVIATINGVYDYRRGDGGKSAIQIRKVNDVSMFRLAAI